MDWSWLQNTIGEYLNKLILWAKDDKRRFVIFLIVVVFAGVVLLPKLTLLLTNFDYIGLITSTWLFIYSGSNTKNFATAIFFIVLFILIVTVKFILQNSTRIFEINIEKQPELWSCYKGSGWSIVEDNTSWNKVLKLTNCTYPAILKYGNDWLNYNFSFETKIPAITDKDFLKEHQNFTFVVRARDKGNGVFFQCRPDGTIRPHLLTNGLFIVDDINTIKFLAEFPTEKWIPVHIEVNGDNVVINIFGVSATYKIPSARLLLPSNEVRSVMNLDKVLKLTDENEHPDTSINSTTPEPKLAFDLDYEKGTVGFRESGKETAMFRKIKIELLQPIYK